MPELTDVEYLKAHLLATLAASEAQKASTDRFRGAIYTLSTQPTTEEAWRVFISELWAVVMGVVKPLGENAEQALWLQEGKRQLALQILLGAKE